MTWYAVADKRSGALFSGTDDPKVLADPMPAEFEVIALSAAPLDGQVWDALTRAFVPFKTDRDVFLEELAKQDATLVATKQAELDRAWTAYEGRIAVGSR